MGKDGRKYVNGKINYQLQKFTPLGLICTAGGGGTAGSNAPGAFLIFFWWSLAPDLHSVKTILAGNLRSFSVYWPKFS